MASSMAAMSTDDIGLAADILREDEMDMRLEVDIDECEDRADATEDDEGDVDRGVEISDEEALGAYEAIACASDEGEGCVGVGRTKEVFEEEEEQEREGPLRRESSASRVERPAGVLLEVVLRRLKLPLGRVIDWATRAFSVNSNDGCWSVMPTTATTMLVGDGKPPL